MDLNDDITDFITVSGRGRRPRTPNNAEITGIEPRPLTASNRNALAALAAEAHPVTDIRYLWSHILHVEGELTAAHERIKALEAAAKTVREDIAGHERMARGNEATHLCGERNWFAYFDDTLREALEEEAQ